MIEDDWKMPDNYWLVDTPDSRFQFSTEERNKICAAQDERNAHVDVVDITGAPVRLTIRAIAAIYISTPVIRQRAVLLSEAFVIQETAARKGYRESLGYLPDLDG